MLSLEFFPRLASLDLQWFVELTADNIFWVFLFTAVVFVYNKKFSFKMFSIIVLAWIAFIDFFDGLGVVGLAGGFIFIYYVGQLVILNFINTVASLKDRIPFVLTIYFFILLAVYNLFLK